MRWTSSFVRLILFVLLCNSLQSAKLRHSTRTEGKGTNAKFTFPCSLSCSLTCVDLVRAVTRRSTRRARSLSLSSRTTHMRSSRRRSPSASTWQLPCAGSNQSHGRGRVLSHHQFINYKLSIPRKDGQVLGIPVREHALALRLYRPRRIPYRSVHIHHDDSFSKLRGQRGRHCHVEIVS